MADRLTLSELADALADPPIYPVELELAPMDRKFVTAHPANVRHARLQAIREGCDYVLRPAIPRDRVIVMDPTKMGL